MLYEIMKFLGIMYIGILFFMLYGISNTLYFETMHLLLNFY